MKRRPFGSPLTPADEINARLDSLLELKEKGIKEGRNGEKQTPRWKLNRKMKGLNKN